MTKKTRLFIVLFMFLCLPMMAQFSPMGSEKASIKWSQIETQSYRIVYPRGMDSLAVEYATSLEKFKKSLAGTSGYEPNQMYRKRHPVVLHPFTAYSNGMAAWAPRRMTLLTLPDAYDPESTVWKEQLAVHESRHVAQAQAGRGDGVFRFLGYLTGDLWTAAAIYSIWPGMSFIEGDAVAAETALSKAGRGRTADFLEYYRVSFASGIYRNYWQWRYSSQKRFTPDYYRSGYILIAGMRNSFDEPCFTNKYFERIFRHPPFYPFFNLQKTVRDVSGMRFRDAFKKIEEDFEDEWEANDALRKPFLETTRISREPRRYESLTGLTFSGDSLYAIRKGIARAPELVLMRKDGSAKRISAFANWTSRPVSYGSRIYWTEYKGDVRWELNSSSVLRYRDTERHRDVTLTKGGKRYYNPAPSPIDSIIALTSVLDNCTTGVALVNAEDGSEENFYPAPNDLQVTETAWVGHDLYAAAISSEGFGIYEVPSWKCLLAPQQVKINRMFGRKGRIWFSSDRDGTTELYSLTPDGKLWQETSLRFGGNDWAFNGDSLYFSAPEVSSRGIFAVAEDSLISEATSFKPLPRRIADKLSAQEPVPTPEDFETSISKPKNYPRISKLFRIHSWAPLYYEYNPVSALSYKTTEYKSYLGVSAFFQNELENSYGQVGASFEFIGSGISPALHAQWIYKGWFPVIELRADVGGRTDVGNFYKEITMENKKGYKADTVSLGYPFARAALNIHVPFNFSSGGWNRGIVPQLKVTATNDAFDELTFTGYGFERTRHSFALFTAASISAYSVLSKPNSCLFPRWGIGGAVSVVDIPFMRDAIPFSPNAQASIYAYVPGLLRTHGFKLSGAVNRSWGNTWYRQSDFYAAAEYAMPFAPVDWTFLCPLFYIRNFELRGYASYSYSYLRARNIVMRDTETMQAYVGGSLGVHLGNFLWSPFGTHVGVKYLYNPIHPTLSGASLLFTVDI